MGISRTDGSIRRYGCCRRSADRVQTGAADRSSQSPTVPISPCDRGRSVRCETLTTGLHASAVPAAARITERMAHLHDSDDRRSGLTAVSARLRELLKLATNGGPEVSDAGSQDR